MGKKTKMLIAAAAIGAAVLAAKKLHEKGYDKKAVKMLKEWSSQLQKEAGKLQKKSTKKAKVVAKKVVKATKKI